MDCFISASVLEGLPISFLEAMAAGLPIVATNYGSGAEDIVEDGKTGFLNEPDDINGMVDNILGLIHDDKLRRDLGQAARNKVEAEFNLQRVVKRREQVYKFLVADHMRAH